MRRLVLCALLCAGCLQPDSGFGNLDIVSDPVTKARVDIPYRPTILANISGADYTLRSGPAGMTINEDTGLIDWTPTLAQLGTHSVHVRAVTSEARAEQLYEVNVALNQAPVIQGAPLGSVCTGASIDSFVYASDPDGDPVTYEGVNLPPGMSVDPDTGLLQTFGLPAQTAGEIKLTWRATDPYGGEDVLEQTFSAQGFTTEGRVNTPASADLREETNVQIQAGGNGSVWAGFTRSDQNTGANHAMLTYFSRGACTSTQMQIGPVVATDNAEDLTIDIADNDTLVAVWIDSSAGGDVVRLQRFDVNGMPLYAHGGIRVSTTYTNEDVPTVVADDVYALVVWRAVNDGTIRLQRVELDGTLSFGADGQTIATATAPDGPDGGRYVNTDYEGGLTVYWVIGTQVIGQRYDMTGAEVWGAGGVVVTDNVNLAAGALAAGIQADGYNYIVYRVAAGLLGVQRVDHTDGTTDWGLAGAEPSLSAQQSLNNVLMSPVAGGVSNGDVFVIGAGLQVSRLSAATGAIQWGPVEAALGASPNNATVAVEYTANADEVVVVWNNTDQNNQGFSNIRIQRLDELGNRLYGDFGREVSLVEPNVAGDGTDQLNPSFAVDKQGRAVVGWHDYRNDLVNGGNSDIFVQTILPNGDAGY